MSLRGLKPIFSTLSPLIPPWLGNPLYRIPFKVTQWVLRGHEGKLWLRHSVALGDVQYGVSDIDLTFQLEQWQNPEEIAVIAKKMARLRFLFPHLGELSILSRASLPDFITFANPLELKRDPFLLQQLEKDKLPIKRETNAHRVAFALQWLASDAHKLKKHFHLRQKKINRFIGLLNVSRPEDLNSFEDLLVLLNRELFSFVFKGEDVLTFLKDFFNKVPHDDHYLNQFYENYPSHRVLMMVLFPQKWIGPSLLHENFEEELEALKGAPSYFHEVFKAQLEWEIWGLYGQWLREGGGPNLMIHLENLLKCARVLEAQGQELLGGIQKLRDFHEELFIQTIGRHAG